jgi:C4-dicarboxylate transporter DctM subunit
MLSLGICAVVFVLFTIMGIPIAFSLGLSAAVGLLIGGYPLDLIGMSVLAAPQSWVLLAVPAFIFSGVLMERCGISQKLVDLARETVGWVRGGLGMTVVGAEILFSGVSGSSLADVSAIGAMVTKPLVRAGYSTPHAVSIIASATAMGILIPPCIFMIVLGTITSTSVVGIFLGAILPGIVQAFCLLGMIYWQAIRMGWPSDARPNLGRFCRAFYRALVPLVVPVMIIGGFRYGIFTATEAGGVCAFYSVLVALVVWRNVPFSEIIKITLDAAILSACATLLFGSAMIYQYLIGVSGITKTIVDAMLPLGDMPWLFLAFVAVLGIFFGLVMEGLPAAMIMVPVVFPIVNKIGIHPIHFAVVLTSAIGIGFFMPPTGVGLLTALKFGDLTVAEQWRSYIPYLLALFIGLLIIILIPELSLILPRSAGIK